MDIIITTDADYQKLIDTNERVAIKFFADWCGSCKLIAPKYKRLAHDERFAGIHFLESNAEENPELRKWAGVSNLPYFVTIHNGKLLKGDATSKVELVEEMLTDLIQA
ncbi:MAG: thioredoxin family protein [Bacteroidetes bacterium]|jgi:thiol-disulfide isomerase/thioredoxin|nr:thioredoxin family protein [Bacteroidota bacterium]